MKEAAGRAQFLTSVFSGVSSISLALAKINISSSIGVALFSVIMYLKNIVVYVYLN